MVPGTSSYSAVYSGGREREIEMSILTGILTYKVLDTEVWREWRSLGEREGEVVVVVEVEVEVVEVEVVVDVFITLKH